MEEEEKEQAKKDDVEGVKKVESRVRRERTEEQVKTEDGEEANKVEGK